MRALIVYPFQRLVSGEVKMNPQRLMEAAIIAVITATITTWANTEILNVKMSEMQLRFEEWRAASEKRAENLENKVEVLTRYMYEHRQH